MYGVRRRKRTNFHASFIAIALSDIKEEKAKKIGRRAAAFLASHQSKEGTWNYWHPSATERGSEPYPDDLDDTASALSAIALFEPGLLGGTDFACFVKSLCAEEAGVGGPYRTWCLSLHEETAQNEIDIGVNAAIGYALSIHKIELSGLSAYIEKAIMEDRLVSRYYFDEITLIYLISRWYRGPGARTLIKKLYERLERISAQKDYLAMSMILSSLCRLGESRLALKGHTEALAREIMRGPKPYGLYIEKIEATKQWHSGSGALTAALCAEAFCLMSVDPKIPDDHGDILYQKIWADALKILNEEKALGIERIEDFIEYGLGSENRRNIALLPFHCCATEDMEFDHKIFIKAGIAHLLGTIAYGVFDKALDGQGDPIDPVYVSLALIAHAECISMLNALSRNHASVSDMIRKMGYKAIWESEKASFCTARGAEISSIPDFSLQKVLENKSIGISLAALSIVSRISSNASTPRYLKEFFSHYCAARHMHDDVHDWKEDLSLGSINSAAAACLTLGVQDESLTLPISCTREKLEEDISRILMSEGIPFISEKIIHHAEDAKKAIERLEKDPHINTEFLYSLISPLQRGAERALREQVLLEEFSLDLAGGEL